ncbi:MAG TPA: 2OG-Fe(II) oxygenase [Caulobacteraceae bacterium]|nr:2OG-Fe(II) oxygenase [Caulobacteraceae bacterium]
MTQAGQTGEIAAPRGLLAPYHVVPNFLEPDRLAALLDFAARHEAEFEPTGVVGRTRPGPDPNIRRSTGLRQLGEFRPLLRARLLDLAPALIAELRLSPFEVSKVELELVAHGDGAYYKRHIDTATARDEAHMRVLSGVYYFHREPCAFSGGALRLYAIGDNARFVDIEPVCNTLLVFPAWAPHEVMPVSVPSRRFADSRFAVNCWLKQRRRTV